MAVCSFPVILRIHYLFKAFETEFLRISFLCSVFPRVIHNDKVSCCFTEIINELTPTFTVSTFGIVHNNNSDIESTICCKK